MWLFLVREREKGKERSTRTISRLDENKKCKSHMVHIRSQTTLRHINIKKEKEQKTFLCWSGGFECL